VLKGVKNKTKKKITWPSRLHIYSNHRTAQSKAYKYLGRTAKLYPGTNSQKNIPYLIKKNNHWVNFGQMGYEDFTKHHNKRRRKNYLRRSKTIRGDWARNPYSANNLSRKILW